MVCLLQRNPFISPAFVLRINHFASPRELKKLNWRAHYRKTLISLCRTSSHYKSFHINPPNSWFPVALLYMWELVIMWSCRAFAGINSAQQTSSVNSHGSDLRWARAVAANAIEKHGQPIQETRMEISIHFFSLHELSYSWKMGFF